MQIEDVELRIKIRLLSVTSFSVAANRWLQHRCDSDSDVCGCRFSFKCTRCERDMMCCGEDMPQHIGREGLCEDCFLVRGARDYTDRIGGPEMSDTEFRTHAIGDERYYSEDD